MNWYNYFLSYFIILLVILLYGWLRCNNNLYDFLNIQITSTINCWVITHFIFYTFIGYYFPKTFFISLLIGILWEIFEYCLGKYANKNKVLVLLGDCNLDTSWWYAKYEDIIANTLGFLLGKYIALHWKR